MLGIGLKTRFKSRLHFIVLFADETRVKEFGLKSMWKSPNGTIRNILNGWYLFVLFCQYTLLPYIYYLSVFCAWTAIGLDFWVKRLPTVEILLLRVC